MEGTSNSRGGPGKFEGLTGGVTYTGHFPSATEVVNEWNGEYALAAAKAA